MPTNDRAAMKGGQDGTPSDRTAAVFYRYHRANDRRRIITAIKTSVALTASLVVIAAASGGAYLFQ